MYHTLYVMYMPHFFYPFICLWTLGFLLPWHFVLLGIKSWVPIQLAWPYMIWSLTITLASLHNKLLFTAPQPHSPALQGGFLLSLQDSRTSLWGSSWLLSRFLTQGHPHTSLLRALPWPPNLTPTASAPPACALRWSISLHNIYCLTLFVFLWIDYLFPNQKKTPRRQGFCL